MGNEGVRRKSPVETLVLVLLFVLIVAVMAVTVRNLSRLDGSVYEAQMAAVQELGSLKCDDLVVFPDLQVWQVQAADELELEVIKQPGGKPHILPVSFFISESKNYKIVKRADKDWGQLTQRFKNR